MHIFVDDNKNGHVNIYILILYNCVTNICFILYINIKQIHYQNNPIC